MPLDNPTSFSGPRFPHLMGLGWLISKDAREHLCTRIVCLLVGPPEMEKRVKFRDKGCLPFLWTRRWDSVRALLLVTLVITLLLCSVCFASCPWPESGQRAGDRSFMDPGSYFLMPFQVLLPFLPITSLLKMVFPFQGKPYRMMSPPGRTMTPLVAEPSPAHQR